MNVIATKIQDAVIIEPKVFGDQRGFFLETYQQQRYRELANIQLPLGLAALVELLVVQQLQTVVIQFFKI